MMNESLSVSRTADAKDHDSASPAHAIQPVREGPESDLNVLRKTVQRASCNDCGPSGESIAAELARIPPLQRASALRGLQQTHGNRYVGRLAVQAKLRLGPAGDRYEQEADRVAQRVVETISSSDQNSVQRQEDEEELEEEDVLAAQRQMEGAILSPGQGSVQRQVDEEDLEEDEELQRKVSGAGYAPVAEGADVGPDLESAIRGARGRGQPLSDRVRQPMERAFGADFGGVRVHTDGEADSLNRSIQARAFTTGQDIFLRQGEYRPGSSEGQRLLAHELTHVVQQNRGAVQREEMQATGRVLQAKEDAPPNRTGMPDHLKMGLENLSGMDFSGVRVHYNSPKPTQLNALAYTQGQEIHLSPGQERHLSHEGWHAVQQMQRRVKPTTQMASVYINDNIGLEKEANIQGNKAQKMYEQVEKSKENESRAVANSVSQEKSFGYQELGLLDNRPEDQTQKSLQMVISNPNSIIQRKLSKRNLRQVKKELKYKYVEKRATKFINLFVNESVVKWMITKALGERFCTYDNKKQVADSLGIRIFDEEKQQTDEIGATVTYDGEYTNRTQLVNKLVDDHNLNENTVKTALERMVTDGKSNKKLKRTGNAINDDKELENLQKAMHASWGIAKTGCTFFFHKKEDKITLVAVGKHVKDAKHYKIIWGVTGYPSKGAFMF